MADVVSYPRPALSLDTNPDFNMPHAVDEDRTVVAHAVDEQDQRDDQMITDLLAGVAQGDALEDIFSGGKVEAGEKADDAIDYEDFDLSEDELPDEEDGITAHETGTDGQPQTNGHGDAAGAEDDGDLFGDQQDGTLEDIDLFGEEGASPPAEESTEVNDFARPQAASGLALPSKNRIALPTFVSREDQLRDLRMHHSPTSLERPDLDEARDDETNAFAVQEPTAAGDEDPMVRKQRELFARAEEEREARRLGGDFYEPPPAPETEMDTFYSIWPTYDPDQIPRFLELFPPRRGKYNWKQPIKPPKPVQPTKLTLELQQDHERSFRITGGASANKVARGEAEDEQRGVIFLKQARDEVQQSDDDIDFDEIDEDEEIGGTTWQDLTMICEDWDVLSNDSTLLTPDRHSQQADSGVYMDDDWDYDTQEPPAKKRKVAHFDLKTISSIPQIYPSLEDPVHAAARVASKVTLDMNDPGLLIEENVTTAAPKKKLRRALGETRNQTSAMVRDVTRRYNISNDEAYELLKENHQHKVRSTLGSMAVEHSLPAMKLQWPFYKVKLDPKQLRSFHRPPFHGERANREISFTKPKSIKRKDRRGKDTQAIFAKAEDLSLGDNSNAMLLEYSEEYPVMLSNFGMGNKLINYYRRKDETDQSRPKEEVGETQVLLPQDRSPFANFGQVEPGEMVPTFQNSMYRAPVFRHEGKPADFLVVCSGSHENGKHYFLRNVENLYTVGQQFPSQEVPGEHSRKVTDAAKRRLKAISYRVYKKSIDPTKRGPPLTNRVVQDHLPGSDIAQNRGKMREFMAYDKNNSVWVPKPGDVVPEEETLRSWIKPEDICLLDSMQVGVQHLTDLGLKKDDAPDDDDDAKEGTNVELQLAPWQTTKNFLNACQGKAMLQLHGEGDPTARGEAFSFIKTSMKGGFRALGESIEDRLDAKRMKENGGHSYNVARQQKAYDESIRRIWKAQHDSLSSTIEHSDVEDDYDEEPESAFGRRGTPRSSFGTPAAFGRRDDESASQFSKMSANQGDKFMVITRTVRNEYGELEEQQVKIDNPRVISAYRKRKMLAESHKIDPLTAKATGDREFDELQKKKQVCPFLILSNPPSSLLVFLSNPC